MAHFTDVAIIRLLAPLKFNDYVQPICLPSSPVPDGTDCIATGWGTTQGENSRNFWNSLYPLCVLQTNR